MQEGVLASQALQDAFTDCMLSRQAMRCTTSIMQFYKFTAGRFVQHGWTKIEPATPMVDEDLPKSVAAVSGWRVKKHAFWPWRRSVGAQIVGDDYSRVSTYRRSIAHPLGVIEFKRLLYLNNGATLNKRLLLIITVILGLVLVR
jgi:hypothetical protein